MSELAEALRGPVPVSESFDARVMAAVHRMPRHRRFSLWSRLTTPRARIVKVRPLSVGVAAAAVALFALLGAAHAFGDINRAAEPIVAALKPSAGKDSPAQRVQFVLVARDAKKVAVVGDFNGWDAFHEQYQAHHRGGGVWSLTAPIPVGHHRYSFVVDDSVWVVDPSAPRVVDNDFGVANSALVVDDAR